VGQSVANIWLEGLTAVDELVAKTIGISEVAQIARIELLLRQYLDTTWNKRVRTAVDRASSLARRLKPAKDISKVVEREMLKWTRDVVPRVEKDTKHIYQLARKAGWRKANRETTALLSYSAPSFSELKKAKRRFAQLLPTFDLVDESAVKAIAEQQIFWVGKHYSKNLSESIAKTAKETMIEAGTDQVAAGKLMSERIKDELSHVRTPGGFHGTSRQYFEGLAANAATVGRTHGQMRSFIDLGVTKYYINATVDRRTCEVCLHMDGKVFAIDHGSRQLNAELGAKTPQDIKSVHPWTNLSRLQAVSPKAGPVGPDDAGKLADAGFSLPPFHYRCRCTVDVSTEAASFETYAPAPLPRPPGVPIPPRPKLPKGQRPREFPKVPSHKTRPDQYFGAALLATYLLSTAKKGPQKGIALRPSAQVSARRELNAIAAERGMISRPIVDNLDEAADIVVSKEFEEDAGFYVMSTGRIDISDQSRKDAARFLKGKIDTKSISGMSTIIRQTMRAHAPATDKALVGIGSMLEEGTVQLATEKILKDTFGLQWHQVKNRSNMVFTAAIVNSVQKAMDNVLRGSESYKKWSKHTRGLGAREVAAEASIKLRGRADSAISADKYLERYVESITLPSELTAGMMVEDVKKLTKKVQWLIEDDLKKKLREFA